MRSTMSWMRRSTAALDSPLVVPGEELEYWLGVACPPSLADCAPPGEVIPIVPVVELTP